MSAPRLTVLAIDPGRDKCGLAVVDEDGRLLFHAVVATDGLGEGVEQALRQFCPQRVLLGDGTSSRGLRPVIEQAMGRATPAVPLEIVSERHTTERGRVAYWKHNPPRGLGRLIPDGLRVPPVPIDDYAAYCMALDYLQCPR